MLKVYERHRDGGVDSRPGNFKCEIRNNLFSSTHPGGKAEFLAESFVSKLQKMKLNPVNNNHNVPTKGL